MAYHRPAGMVFKRIDLDVADRSCPVCERCMHVCDHRYHHLWTLEGPTQVVNRLVRCPEPSCASRGRTFSPEAELSISMPRWCLGWDVFCWLGHRRFLAIGRCLSFVWSYRTRTRSGCPTMQSSIILASIKRCWQPVSKTLHSSLRPTGISRRWC
jgi:hypothetical protein